MLHAGRQVGMLIDWMAGSPVDRYLIIWQAGTEAGRQTGNEKGRQACRRQEKMQERQKIMQKGRTDEQKERKNVRKGRKAKQNGRTVNKQKNILYMHTGKTCMKQEGYECNRKERLAGKLVCTCRWRDGRQSGRQAGKEAGRQAGLEAGRLVWRR
jgi:hypothetical protein